MSHDNRPIGVFDSGLGGLTSVKRIKALLPNENIIYFGDTARTPYGSKSVATINRFSVQIAEFLYTQNVKAIAIACNTVSAASLSALTAAFPDIPFIDIIKPMVESLPNLVKADQTVAVIGTEVTISSGSYEQEIKKVLPKAEVVSRACPLFVTLIEQGLQDDPVMDSHIDLYLSDFIEINKPDYLILGCTHYPLIQHKIQKMFPELKLLDPAFAQAEKIKEVLEQKNIRAATDQKANYQFYASDLSDIFRNMINRIMSDEQYSLSFNELKL
ncbi:MAG: glutamate racemase [Clostridiaceae bacterium]|nr:glutamate racemase [Bacillota bacterium]NLN51387.1 glutamate racemase [Clostridiaceae bacterium]